MHRSTYLGNAEVRIAGFNLKGIIIQATKAAFLLVVYILVIHIVNLLATFETASAQGCQQLLTLPVCEQHLPVPDERCFHNVPCSAGVSCQIHSHILIKSVNMQLENKIKFIIFMISVSFASLAHSCNKIL